jgi:hypothetical protein
MGRIAAILLVLAVLGMVVPAGTVSACKHGAGGGEAGAGGCCKMADDGAMACHAADSQSPQESGGKTKSNGGCAMVCCMAGVSMSPDAGLARIGLDMNDRVEGAVEEQVQSRSDRPDSPPPREWVV